MVEEPEEFDQWLVIRPIFSKELAINLSKIHHQSFHGQTLCYTVSYYHAVKNDQYIYKIRRAYRIHKTQLFSVAYSISISTLILLYKSQLY